MKKGYSLTRTQKFPQAAGFVMPALFLGFFILMLFNPPVDGAGKSGMLFYSLKGPGAAHAPVWISLVAGLVIGVLAQRSRFCTMGAFRDLILFRQMHLFLGVASLVIAAWIANMVLGQFNAGFENQPVVPAMEAIGGTGDIITGLAAAFSGLGEDPLTVCIQASAVSRLAGALAVPNPGTRVIEIIEHIPAALEQFFG